MGDNDFGQSTSLALHMQCYKTCANNEGEKGKVRSEKRKTDEYIFLLAQVSRLVTEHYLISLLILRIVI